MKKLIMAVAIVCATVAAQAASISWKSNFNYVTNDGAIQTAATADAGTFVLVYLGSGTADWDSAVVVNEGSVTYATAMGTQTAKALGAFNFDYATSGYSNGDIFGVMFKDTDGNLSKLQTTGGDPIENTFAIAGMSDNTYAGVMSFATSNYTVASVPEPTSALLLILGVAGLALRRKQK